MARSTCLRLIDIVTLRLKNEMMDIILSGMETKNFTTMRHGLSIYMIDSFTKDEEFLLA